MNALRDEKGTTIGFPAFRYVEPDMTERECPVCGARFVVVMVREPNGGDLKPDNTVELNHWMTRHEPQEQDGARR